MISISNLFTTENNNDNKKEKTNVVDSSPALNQGINFKNYKYKITNSLEKNAENLSGKEGFTGLGRNGLTSKTKNIINNNDYSREQKSIDDLRQEYDNTLHEYEKLLAEVSGDTAGYINRVNSNNPYLNKTIRFTTGTAYKLKIITEPTNIIRTWFLLFLPFLSTFVPI